MNIIYLGDSITDVGKNENAGSKSAIGQGYALITSAKLGATHPQEHTFRNSGISGSRVVDLYARIKMDAWNHAPDVISILVGVNDVWHELGEGANGVDVKRFENVYRMLLHDTLERFPNVKFMLLEPFVLRGAATEEKWDVFSREVFARAEVVRKIAEEFGAVFVSLQKPLNDACAKAPASYWLADGVHPTPAGHQLIADAWLEAFAKLK